MGNIIKTQKQLTGLEEFLPSARDVGTQYICSDSGKFFIYDKDRSPREIALGEGGSTTRIASSRNANVSADGKSGRLDPNGLAGWHFENEYQGEKVNWYYVYNQNEDNVMTLETLTSMYAVVTIYKEREFHFSVYTKRENDGLDYSWYRSRVNYELTTAFDGLAGETVLVYFGEEPTTFEDLLL